MKIGILTHYDVHNHGALLQLNALTRVLESKGHSVSALTYKKNYDFMAEGLDKKYDISIRSLFFYLSYIPRIGICRTLFNVKKKRILDKTRNSLKGEYYSSAKNLDAVFIGSDEVFSIETGLNPFFFGYGIPCNQIYTYAACFGPTTIKEIEAKRLKGFIRSGLENIIKISVRDENTKSLVQSVAKINAPIVCDPVILYGYNEEIANAECKIRDDYLLIYAYDNNMNAPAETEKIIRFARRNNLKVISAGFYHKWCDKCVDGSPIDILGYFKYAKYVITDTFHGSVMSLICNANFIAKIRGNRNKLHNLLTGFNLSDRIIENFDELEKSLTAKIDYTKVNEDILSFRRTSMEYLDECLNTETEKNDQ